MHGIGPAFDSNTDKRKLQNTACDGELYDVDLVIGRDRVSIMLEPTKNATSHGCTSYYWMDAYVDTYNMLHKESFQLQSIFDLHDQLSKVHGTILTMGAFVLSSVETAYHSASASAPGYDEEGSFDPLWNNLGDFVANFFAILGHTSSHVETILIAAALMMATPDLVVSLRKVLLGYDIADKMTDEEVVIWFVEQRTLRMYGSTGSSN